jgi:hypothetical protein
MMVNADFEAGLKTGDRDDLSEHTADSAVNDSAGNIDQITTLRGERLNELSCHLMSHIARSFNAKPLTARVDLRSFLYLFDDVELIEAALRRVVVTERVPHANAMRIEPFKVVRAALCEPSDEDAPIGALLLRTATGRVSDERVVVRPDEARELRRKLTRDLETDQVASGVKSELLSRA